VTERNGKEAVMAIVNALPKEKAHDEVKPLYDAMTKNFGRMPGFFGVMAHRPGVLKTLVPLYGAIMNEGTVEPKLKELAYLKTSLVNGCEY
jgi:alkylhydroperoxidase family enzyme